MSKLISALKLLKRWNIEPSQLFDYVKSGLHPFDKDGNLIPPPIITEKSELLKILERELKELSLEFVAAKVLYQGLVWEKNKEMLFSRHDKLSSDIENLKRELRNTENFYWSNYELPADKELLEQKINLMLNYYFRIKDVKIIEKDNPVLTIADSGSELKKFHNDRTLLSTETRKSQSAIKKDYILKAYTRMVNNPVEKAIIQNMSSETKLAQYIKDRVEPDLIKIKTSGHKPVLKQTIRNGKVIISGLSLDKIIDTMRNRDKVKLPFYPFPKEEVPKT